MNKTTIRIHPVVLLALLILACASPPAAISQCPTLVWSDEFDGTAVDQANWSFQTGDGCAEGICGWGNNELQSYQEANATVSNGTLKIEAREERIRNKAYTSARIRTINKQDFFFGRFEARLKLPFSQGLWPAFWMLPTDEVFGGWPQSGEIDIMENIGSQLSTSSGAIHFGDPFPDNQFISTNFNLVGGAQFRDDFHTFAIEKQPGIIQWFVDDILFATHTPADTDPFNWPFDERFHFLLNVAVGGNFPGDPDGSSVFPQVLEADYVRVYDGQIPYISGDQVVANQEAGVVYSIGNAPAGSSFSWTVPAGATIVSGQNTSSITVDWGGTSGDVVADISNGCGNEQRRIPVEVEPVFNFDFTFDNFDDPGNATVSSSTGTLSTVANPDTSGINPSTFSGEYIRNSAEQFDVLVYDTTAIPNAGQYVDKTRKFFMDVFTTAPPGTLILVQLEDSSQTTASNFPTGRHSRFEAFTSAQNAWERLDFGFLDRPDASVPDTSVDTIIVLFASNTFTGDTFTYDNFDSYLAEGAPGDPPAAPSNLIATAISSSAIDLTWSDNSTDEDGFEIERSTDGVSFSQIATAGAGATAFSDGGLAASTTYTYRVRAQNANGASAYSNTDSATTQGGGAATTLHVDSIVVGTQGAGQGNKRGTATVTIRDNTGGLVGTATVTGTFTGDFNETQAGDTAGDGTVTLLTDGTKKGSIVLTFCVDDVTHGTLTYDPASNVVTCASL